MSCYCINPLCDQRQNPDNIENCLSCGTSLLINDRIRLIKPLRALTQELFTYMEVFEVEDAGTQWNPVREQRIMKVLRWGSPKMVELIEQEALTLQLIHHPRIPKSTLDDFFTFVPNDTQLTLRCLVMDKVEGQNLEQWIEFNGRISQSLALEWFRQLIEILHDVHRSNFFHRDIKPSNIILQSNGQLSLIDFGVARRVTDTYLAKISGSGGTNTGRGGRYEITSVVTPGYTSLEQIEGRAVPQSDFFALGRTLVHLVTATPPVDLSKDTKTGNLLWRKDAPQIDKPFADFIDELMAPLPGNRPATTEVILQRLDRLPFKSKLNRVIKSKPFQLSVFVLGLLSIVGLIYASLPLVAKYYLDSGKKAYKENQIDQAENDFQKAVYFNTSLKYTVADYFLNQGKEAYKENRIADAEKDFQRAIKYGYNLTNSVSNFYFEKGLQHQNNPKIARKNYELAIKYNPKDDTAYNNLAIVCQQLYDYNCVNKTYEIIFKLKPNKWESHYGLGDFYDGQGEYDLAEKQYEIAIRSSDQAIFAVAALARLKNKKGDYKAAATLALNGLQKTNNKELQASLYKDLGWSRLMENKLTEAEKYLEKATKLDSERTDAYCLLSQIEESLGQLNYARAYIDACILTKSSLPEVFRWRQELLDRILDK
ncbi:protein kinase domain-containing protein [Nostoc sp. 'Lobaria pulmonaria (5183) cyanobiont']|uniref:protein kinase domain-containing protein n=1 Tax=Nostoc sp. 'Lobaria pulmonaria (5183) cyanobiont' TaxID=1618022 RepID=UPI000CF30B90|nr:tetratricopeptide repeat protein [Nostoc sp. 'Lobaria pulmonaria (5183) cyanobiont']AVH74294.1 TPR repeat-containing serine/threonine protein kinase [Nostoc sp. 'Lobaria pulmonaria (5183) cyanobiont']